MWRVLERRTLERQAQLMAAMASIIERALRLRFTAKMEDEGNERWGDGRNKRLLLWACWGFF